MSFTRFFTKPGLLTRMSDDKLREFSKDNNERIRAMNTDGRYDQMAADSTQAMQAFSDAINEEDRLYAKQQMMTKKVDAFTRKFRFAVQDFAGQVRNEFGRDSAEYQLFFPNGLREYSNVKRKNADTLMNRIVKAFASFNNQFGTGPQQLFEQIRNDYTMLRQQQQELIAKVSAAKLFTSEKRGALEKTINENLLRLALEYVGQPEITGNFFSLSMMAGKKSVTDSKLEGNVPPGEIVNLLSEGVGMDTELELINTGQTELIFALSDDPETLKELYGAKLKPGSKLRLSGAAIGPEGNSFFNVKNLSTEVAGAFEVEVLGG